ncbi:sugar transferase [Ruminococcus difficilis]|uniref:Sugar transferase n=1 Tax=Ruminococcus difficilis TaxID=2763069 RepID=A0A934U007_9FIRM|nr:sugar transferase [Ruminococcus difficilis]MBK6088063.1 sugar transferase [Ruminococcus difficilis]
MILLPFEKLPRKLQCDEVKKYYEILDKKRPSLVMKRVMDIILSLIMIVLLILPMAVIAIIIKLTSKGPVLYKQMRVTTNNRRFKIWKFRTMTVGADQKGALVTSANDNRVTGIGKTLRKFRLDELPQVFHVLSGKMSFVGTRPEVVKYVERYTPEMMATLLMPAGITSLASIRFKDEDAMIGDVSDPDEVDRIYVEEILPKKMRYNLKYLYRFGFRRDLYLMLSTVKHVFTGD